MGVRVGHQGRRGGTAWTVRRPPPDAAPSESSLDAPAPEAAATSAPPGARSQTSTARSGTGAASSNYGYSWTISYDGFQGKIPPPRAPRAAPEVNGNPRKAAGANVTVAPAPDRYGVRGLGTHTAKATIVVGATAKIVEGAFRVTVDRGGPNTGGRFARNSTCLAWDASAEDVQEALISMRMFDSVRVVRRGDASLRDFLLVSGLAPVEAAVKSEFAAANQLLQNFVRDDTGVGMYVPDELKDAVFCGHLVADLDSIAGAIGGGRAAVEGLDDRGRLALEPAPLLRDLPRGRALLRSCAPAAATPSRSLSRSAARLPTSCATTVSYTQLTLPTKA